MVATELIDMLLYEGDLKVVVRLQNGSHIPITGVVFEYNRRDERVAVLCAKDKRIGK